MRLRAAPTSLSVLLGLVFLAPWAHAQLPAGTLLTLDVGVADGYGAGTPIAGSFFDLGGPVLLSPGSDGGIVVGKAQSPSPNFPISSGELGEIDEAWAFAGNFGNIWSTGTGLDSDDFSNIRVAWGGATPAIPMGTGFLVPTPSTPFWPGGLNNPDVDFNSDGSVNGLEFRDNGDGTYDLNYGAQVPDGDPSGFGNALWFVHFEGNIIAAADDADGDGYTNGAENLCGNGGDWNDNMAQPADADGDLTPDCLDQCPNDAGKTDPGVCGCGVADVDSDADGVLDCNDICPGFDDGVDTDGDGVPDGCDVCPGFDDAVDTDMDSVPDGCDVCPGSDDTIDNLPPGGDGTPDCLQTDSDGDGILDASDNCPGDPNGPLGGPNDQLDTDLDGIGDVCDNCPAVSNATQTDTDMDGLGDACDACPNDAANDADGDGVCGDVDNCPAVSNAGQANADGDSLGDACDTCPNDANNDVDGDGLCGDVDNCPAVANVDQANVDGDALGDACDACPNDPANDADGDGVCGDVDQCPGADDTIDLIGDPTTGGPDGVPDCLQSDADGDGILDADDNCPSDANTDQADADGDGPGDVCDVCPNDPDDDADGDGVCVGSGFHAPKTGDNDAFPDDPAESSDVDDDGVGDNADACDLVVTTALPTGTLLSIGPGSFFAMVGAGSPVDLFPGPDGGIVLGTVQPGSGSHGGVPGCDPVATPATCKDTVPSSESPRIDAPWAFFNNTGLDFTTIAPVDNGDGTINLSGWRVTWNGIAVINMGGGIQDCGTDSDGICVSGSGAMAVDIAGVFDNGSSLATFVVTGDTYTLDYSAVVPQADPSNFGGVHYELHLEGAITIPPGDQDGDGVPDATDNCPGDANADQADLDGDGEGDVCDVCPNDSFDDLDQDCLCGDFDPDRDGDGILNAADPTPDDDTDTDGDGLIDNIDPDDDNDGILDGDDANPLVFDDFDGDGIGDGNDPDDDNDGVDDVDDAFPFNPFDSADVDNDGSGDIADACDDVPASASIQASSLAHTSAVGDPLVEDTLLTLNPGSADCSATDVTTGSCFYMEVSTGIFTITGLKPGADRGIVLGSGQPHQTFAEQLAGTPAGIDAVWNFFSNTGNTYTTGNGVEETTLSDGVTRALSFRTWTIFWNNKEIPLTAGLDTVPNNDDDLVPIVTDTTGLDPFTDNYFKENPDDTYELVYNTLVPEQPASGFENVHYTAFLRGRVVRPTTGVLDTDEDLVPDNQDNCPSVPNTDQANEDGDGSGDVCDVCPSDAFDDADGDCLCGNAEDADGAFGFDDDNDGDGVLNVEDAFPDDPVETVDTDSDGIGNNADTDDDGDCIPDVLDSEPLDADLPTDADGDCVPAAYDADDGNPFVQVDQDGDGLDDVQPRDGSGDPVSPPAGTLLAGGVVIGANGGHVAVDAPRVTQLAEAAVEVDDDASRSLARAAARLQGTVVAIPSGTTIDGSHSDGVFIGIGLAEGEGARLSVALASGGTLETTVVGLPVLLIPEGATFGRFALVTLVYSIFDIPTGVIHQEDLGVVHTSADGTMTLFGDCDDTVDRNADGTVDDQDLDVDCIAARDTSAHTITVRTSHFSTFAVTTGDTDGDGIADNLDAVPTVPEDQAGDSHDLNDRNLFSVVNKNGKDAFGCAASPSGGNAPWSALAVLLLPLGSLATLRRRRSWMRHLPWIVTLVALGLAAAPALATTTLYPTGFGAKMAAMGGAGNASGDDATAVAVNPANLTKIDGWRVDLDVGALISNVSYDDGEVNDFAGGRFEINEGTLYFLPTVGIARKMGRLGIGFGMWGQGGGGLIYQNMGFNDVSPVQMGGGREIFMTNGSDLTGENRLTAENAIREDNYTLMIIGRFGLAFSYDLTDDLTVAVEPLQDYGFLKFGIFGSIEMAPHGVQARHIGSNDPGSSTRELGIDGIVARNSKTFDPTTTDGIITRREAKIALGVGSADGVRIADTRLAQDDVKRLFDYTVEDGTHDRITTTVAGGQAFRRFLDPDTAAATFPVNAADTPQEQAWATHQQEVAQNTAQGFPTHGQLFAGRTFNQFILDREGPTAAADDQWMVTYDGHGNVVELPVDGVQRIADFFRQPTDGQTAANTPALFRKRIWNFELYDDAATGEQRGRTTTSGDPINEHADINETLNAVTRSLMAQPFYDSTQFTDAEHDYVVDEFFGLFQDVFPDFGFGMGEVSAFASGRGFEDFANAVKVGARWQVAPWLSIGGSYTSKSSVIMRDGGIKMDFTNQIQQGLDVGMRMMLAMNTVFDELGMTQFAEFIDTVADGVATNPVIQDVDFAVAPGSDPTVTSSQQIFNELPKLGDVERLLTEAPSFGDATHGPGSPTNPGSDRAIPTNQQLDLTLTGSSGRPEDNFTGDDAHSVEMLTRSAAGLFRTFSSLMGYVENQQFQSVTSQPNYEIPKRLNDPTNDTATLGINSAAGTFHNGSGTLVQSAARDQEVIDYYRDIARFLRGFGVASIANPDGDAATQAVAVAQVQGLLDPANYATPEEFLTAYDALRSQFEVAGTFRSDITITLPQQAEVGIEVKPLPRLRLTSDVKWIDYSDAFQQFAATLRDADNPVFQRFLGLKPEPGQLDFGQVNDFTFKEELNWHDQWVFSFGTAYDLLDNFTVMAGYSFTGRRLNDLWNNFGEAQSAMDGENNMAMLPAFGYETGSVGFSYRWNNKEISFALERAFTTTVFSGSPNQANSQYSNSQESANQDTVHVQYSLLF